MTSLARSFLEEAVRLNLWKKKYCREYRVFWLSQKTKPNWCSSMCRCGCSVLFVSCRHPAQGSLTEADSRQPVKFSTDTTVWQQLNYYDTSHNQRGCREYRHLFSTDGQGIAVNAQYSIQVGTITPNVWIIWLIYGDLRGKDWRQLCDINAYLDTILSHECHTYRKHEYHGGLSFDQPPVCIPTTPDQKN